jgi:hypothetical protein
MNRRQRKTVNRLLGAPWPEGITCRSIDPGDGTEPLFQLKPGCRLPDALYPELIGRGVHLCSRYGDVCTN